MKNTFSVLFFVKKDKQKINGSYPIFVRITIDGVASRFNSKLDVQPKLWDGKAGKAAGRSAEATRINRLLDDINASLNTIYHELQRRDNYVTAEKVKNEFLGHSENHDTILNLFQKHNDDVKQLVGISKTIATYRKYEVTRRHLAEFIQSKYNLSDISIKEITPMFITDFELYLRTTCKCGYNTTAKFMQFFKRIILIARNNGILIGDPFANYKIRLEKVDRGYLTEDEIKIILKKKMVSERLEQVRDVFIFSCFSGLAYVDVANLKEDNIRKSFDHRGVRDHGEQGFADPQTLTAMIRKFITKAQDWADGKLRRLAGRISPDMRVAIILVMLAAFGALSVYMTVSSIYRIGRNDGKELGIEHIRRLQLPNDSIINPFESGRHGTGGEVE